MKCCVFYIGVEIFGIFGVKLFGFFKFNMCDISKVVFVLYLVLISSRCVLVFWGVGMLLWNIEKLVMVCKLLWMFVILVNYGWVSGIGVRCGVWMILLLFERFMSYILLLILIFS